jgi:CheY-like chemotaxis protein
MAKTLLLADDSVTIQKVVSISFASEDVTLVTVDNGDDAITRARETRPDLILADVVMPGKSGYEVCEAIKADPDLAHIPVLLLTGAFESFDEERANRVGAAGHVAKPFEAQTLVSQVKQLLAEAPAPASSVTDTSPIVPSEPATSPSNDPASAGFDFFDDDIADVETPSDSAVDFGESDSSFAFVDDDVAAANPPPDHTVAMIDDDPLAALLGDRVDDAADPDPIDPFSDTPAAPPEESEDSFSPMAPAIPEDDAFDFSLPGDEAALAPATPATGVDASTAGVDVGDLAQATILDPRGASSFDVSSSDLGSSLPDDIPVAAAVHEEPLATDEEPAAAILEPEFEPESESLEIPIAVESAQEMRPLPTAAAASTDSVLAEIAPALREQLHDTLEKIAWESFGAVTEKVVSETVDRIEKIAWEVIPQLAETLIKQEIRRLKGEDEG